MAMIRHQPWPMYVPSAMTVWRLASGGAMRGRMRQHHAIRLRRARASPAESAALWDDGPSSQERNSSSVRSRLRRRCGIVELNRQAGHFHRWTPLPVRPFFFIARPHTGHLFALLDGVLTPSSPPPGAHHFPRDKNDRPTRLLPQGRATVISTTKVPIGLIWLLLAIAFLPVDGTTLGLYAPFWSPISPALFAVYCLCNWRQLRIAANRYLPMFLLPVACIILSIPGWLKFGIHLNAAFMSITGLLGVLATLGAIALAFDIKRIPWRTPLRILIASYWVSFGVGVVQWLSIRLHAKPLTDYFSHLMYRQYISDNSVWGGGRPQFLFAEPSYIGMHLFGILLPLMWLMRGRDRIYAKRLRDLIVTYAVGAVLMQAGTRIVIDSVVALLIALVARTDWHDGARRVRGMLQILGACALGLLGVLADSRLSAIAENGAEGDGSFFARIYQSLDPICGLLTHPWTLLTGYGAGNIINAVWAGAAKAGRLLDGLGMNGGAATGFAAGVNADTVWTMCAYTSVIAEYGLIGLAMLVGASMVCMTRGRTVCRGGADGASSDELAHGVCVADVADVADVAGGNSGGGVAGAGSGESGVWHKTVICWLVLVAYLYIQCENYAFAALPLLVFAASKVRREPDFSRADASTRPEMDQNPE